MGTETMKGSNYAWAIAIACVAFYAIPLGVHIRLLFNSLIAFIVL